MLDTTPVLKLNTTISHPIETEKVIGFRARDTKIGLDAIVMKEAAIEGEMVLIPTGESDGLINDDAELVVLLDETVLLMDPSNFAVECGLHTVEGRGQTVQMNSVNLESEAFHDFDRDEIEISN